MAEYKSRFTGQEIDAGVVKANQAIQPNDKISKLQNDSGYLTEHQHLKTINDQSIIGYGNIVIEGGSGTSDYENLSNKPSINSVELDGNKSLEDLGIQPELVSEVNIKTINGNSILGEGNLVIEGGSGGLSSVAHDGTMTGAGTNESPLGLSESVLNSLLNVKVIDATDPSQWEDFQPTQAVLEDIMANDYDVLNLINAPDTPNIQAWFAEEEDHEDHGEITRIKKFYFFTIRGDGDYNDIILQVFRVFKTDEDPAEMDILDELIATKNDIPDISGKQDTIDSSHKLSADLIADGSTNKTVTAADKTAWSGKQDALVSGTTIKTINGESLLGTGDIEIAGSGTYTQANPTLDGTEDYLKGLKVGNTKYSAEPDLSGKVISVMGDSISTFIDWIPNSRGNANDGYNLRHSVYYPNSGSYISNVNMCWWYKLIFKEFKAKLGINESWSGSFIGNNKDSDSATYTVCHGNDTGPNTCMASIRRIKNLASNGTPDIIYFYGGTNDIAQPGTPGESLGTFDSTVDYSTVDLTTTKWTYFTDAFRTAIMRMQYFYPKAKIIVLLPTYCNTYYNRAKLDQWVEQMKNVCDYFGVNYIDLRASGITWSNRTMTLGDGNIHPNDYGMTLIADYVKRKTLSILENDFVNNVVYTVTHNLSTLSSNTLHIKGVSSGNSFTGTITGSDLTRGRIYMGGNDITSTAYNSSSGAINITQVTGDILISEGEPQQIPVESVSINAVSKSVMPGDVEVLTATVSPNNATNKTVVWSVDNSNVTISPNGLNCTVTGAHEGTSIVTVTTVDGSYTASCTFTVHEIHLESIEITTPPSKVSYQYGETFNTNGMVVMASYDDGTTDIVEPGEYSYSPSGPLTSNDTTITVSYTYNGTTKTDTQTITVASLQSIAITTLPTTTSYYAGQTFDPTGMIVTATWSDGSTSTVNDYTYSPNGALTTSDTLITISYTAGTVTKTATQVILVEEGSITWSGERALYSSLPNSSKPTYASFADVDQHQSALSGKTITAIRMKPSAAGTIGYGTFNLSDKSSATHKGTITVTAADVGTVTIYPITSFTVGANEGAYIQESSDTGLFYYNETVSGLKFNSRLGTNQTIGTTNGCLGVDFQYIDTPPVLDSISVYTQPTKTAYTIGEVFDPAGMVIHANYSDGTSTAINNYTYYPMAELTSSDTGITISYTEGNITETVVQPISVVSGILDSIAITTAPAKVSYGVGEVFDPSGMVVTATFSDNSTAVVNDYVMTRTTTSEKTHYTGEETIGSSNSVLNLNTFWLPSQHMGKLPGSTLKSITIGTGTAGIMTIRGYDTGIDGTLDVAYLKAHATAANTDGYDICTINLESGTNTYLLDGTDNRVTIISQAAINNCPVMLGFAKTGDTGIFKYHNSSTGIVDDGCAGFFWQTAGSNTTVRTQRLDFVIDYEGLNDIEDPLTLEDENIIVTYSYNGVSESATQFITVAEIEEPVWYTNTYQFEGWGNPTTNSITTAGDFGYSGSDVKALCEDKTINMVRLVPARAGTITIHVWNDDPNIVGMKPSSQLRDTTKEATITITQDMVSQGGYQEIPMSNSLYIAPGQFWTIATAGDTGLFKFVNSTTIPGWPNGYRFYNQLGVDSKAVILTEGQNALCVDVGYDPSLQN